MKGRGRGSKDAQGACVKANARAALMCRSGGLGKISLESIGKDPAGGSWFCEKDGLGAKGRMSIP